MAQTRYILWLATVMLFVRSVIELGITAVANGPNATRQSTGLARDVSYGLMTSLYLLLMCIMAKVVASPSESGGKNVRQIQSNIRGYIVETLKHVTDDGRRQSPDLLDFIRTLEADLPNLLDGRLSEGSTMTPEDNYKHALAYIETLKGQAHRYDPRAGTAYQATESRTSSGLSTLIGRLSGGRLASGSSDSSLKKTLRKTSGQSLRLSGGSRDFTPPGTNNQPSRLNPVLEPHADENTYDGFDTASRYTASVYTTQPTVRPSGPRNFTPPGANYAFHEAGVYTHQVASSNLYSGPESRRFSPPGIWNPSSMGYVPMAANTNPYADNRNFSPPGMRDYAPAGNSSNVPADNRSYSARARAFQHAASGNQFAPQTTSGLPAQSNNITRGTDSFLPQPSNNFPSQSINNFAGETESLLPQTSNHMPSQSRNTFTPRAQTDFAPDRNHFHAESRNLTPSQANAAEPGTSASPAQWQREPQPQLQPHVRRPLQAPAPAPSQSLPRVRQQDMENRYARPAPSQANPAPAAAQTQFTVMPPINAATQQQQPERYWTPEPLNQQATQSQQAPQESIQMRPIRGNMGPRYA
jgi:hypothetical protein